MLPTADVEVNKYEVAPVFDFYSLEVEDGELTWNEYKGFVGASFAAPGTGQRPIALYGEFI